MPRPHKLYSVWSQVPPDYYQIGTRNLGKKLWHSVKINLAKKVLAKTKFTNCLDVGSASGFMISRIRETFPEAEYFGVDVYDRAIKFAQKKYPEITFKVAPAEKLPFKDNTFDLVTCYETIEHVQDPLKSLKEMRRVLKPSGTAIVTMDSGNWLFRIVWFISENTVSRVWLGAHLHPFHHSELEQMIKKSGFKVKRKIFSHLGMEVSFVVKKS